MARRESTEPVPAITVNPSVWADALRQADGDAARIEIVSPTSVVVHNRSDWRDSRPTTNGTERKPAADAESEPDRPAIPIAHPLHDPSATATTTGPVATQPIQVPTFVAPPPRRDNAEPED
jgi:hypothetical protein